MRNAPDTCSADPVLAASDAVIKLRRRPQCSNCAAQDVHHRLEVSEEDRELSFERLRNVFHLPISKAAKQLNVGVTVMKKYCRWYCVDRWPYRKIHSVDKLIAVLKELQATSTTNEVMDELIVLRTQIISQPALDLDANIRRLRQAVFKWQYKQRHT